MTDNKYECPQCHLDNSLEPAMNNGLVQCRNAVCGLRFDPRSRSVPNPHNLPPKQDALATQPGGDHYKGRKIQPVEYIEANDLRFLEGCIIKRATRHGEKTGAGVKDLEKIIHEARLIAQLRYGVDI
jgi:hypothetical protein